MTRVSSRRRGFTLIELLVVIGIIALMIGILFPVVGSALNRASKARAQNDMAQIVAAIKAYYGDNGKMPVPAGLNGQPDRTYGRKGMANNQNLVMNILRGVDTTNNRGGRVYLDYERSGTNAVVDKNGDNYVPADGYFLDPWDNPYVICMDTDFDNDTEFSGLETPPSGSAPSSTFTASGMVAAVVCYGVDPSKTNSFFTSLGSR